MSFTAGDIMTPDYPTACADETVFDATQKIVASHIPAIPVVDGDRKLTGVLTQVDILQLVAQGSDIAAMRNRDAARGYTALEPGDTLEEPRDAVMNGVGITPVVKDGRLLGVVMPIDVSVEQRLLDVLGERAMNLKREISPHDEMYDGLRGMYLQQGVAALMRVKRAMRLASLRDASRILDLACGHGRVLRFLGAAFPEAELTACDINRDGVDFCAATFDAKPVYSDADPSKIPLQGEFDLVWVGSLFTHLDRARWLDFLSFAVDKVASGGVLVFTTLGPLHSPALRDFGLVDDQIGAILDDYERDGFGFQNYVDNADWGLTVCSEEFVVSAIESRPEVRLLDYAPSNWGLQNVVACAKE